MSDAQSKELCETSDGVICSGKGEQYFLLFGGVWEKHFLKLIFEYQLRRTFLWPVLIKKFGKYTHVN